MLLSRCYAVLLLLVFPLAATAGQLQFTNTPLDTSTLPRITQSEIGQKADNAEPVTLIVQFSRPIQPGDVEAMESVGATVHNYIPDYAYLVTAPADVALQMGSVPGVEWAGMLPGYAKLSRGVAKVIAAAGASKSAGATVQYIILSVDAYAAKALEAKGYRIQSARKTAAGWYETRVTAPLAKATDLASVNSVFRIESVPVYELHGERGAQTAAGNVNAGGTAPTGPGYVTWLASKGLSGGNGITVQVQDDGLDKGIATNLPGTAHADILGRIAGIFNATSDSAGDSRAGHGMINAGIIMGNASIGTTDSAGFKLGQGLAPQASVYATKIFTNNGAFDIGSNTLTSLARNAQNAGARFSSNSWGASVDGDYTSDCAEFDALTRDSDPNEPGNQPMVYFFSAGNDGPSNGTLGSPGSAKNVITIGAGENSDADGTDGCLVTPSSSNSNRDIVDFSSRGPTTDNRFGVTLIAVGTHVQGPASTVTGYDGTGVCDKYWPSGQTNYARSSGTSHSCPTACGAALIVQELFNEQLSAGGAPAFPSPAMFRAVLTNTATDLFGGNDGNGGTNTHVPNPQQGWGAVNLGTLLSFKDALYVSDQENMFTATGQSFEVLLSRVDASKPIKFTLAWTDAPGVPGTVALVNDLNLEVESNGTLYKGNVFTNGFSTTGGSVDNRNTIEAVYLNNPAAGPMTVRVRAANIAGNGVPNVGGTLDQDFALFATNATTQSFRGFVSVSPALVSCSSSVTVVVSDSDLKGFNTIPIDITTSTGDSETITLNETNTDSGVFEASVQTRSGGPLANGKLDITNGAIITAFYDDADDGTGHSAQVTDASTVDCVAPQVTNVQVSSIFSNQATVTFQTDELAIPNTRFGLSCSALNRTAPGSENMQHAVVLTGLAPATTYFFVIDAADRAGNTSTANNGSCFSFSTSDQPDFFTELFSDGTNDVDRQTLTFTPDGSASFYSVCKTGASLFPTNPNTGTVLNLDDDGFVQINLTGGKAVRLYSVNYTSFYVGSNGNITFSTGSSDFTESLDLHFAQPRISALFDDLTPDQQHPVRFQQLSDRAVITWVSVPEFATTNANSFQVEMFFDGVIRITHLDIAALDGLVGLSKGLGVPPDFAESDMSAYAPCDVTFTISGTIAEIGAGALAGVILNGLPGSPVTGANGTYSATVPVGFTGTVTPQKTGYKFSPASRTYTNISGNSASQDYSASQGSLSVTPTSADVAAAGGDVDLTIANTSAGTFLWQAQVISGTSWAQITSGASGTNSGTVHITVDPSDSANVRTATVRVTAPAAFNSPIDVTITQAAGSSLNASPSSRTVGFRAGTTNFGVSNAGGGTLNWDAQVTSGNSWLSITSGENGVDDGTINLAFVQNTGAQRSGTILVTSDAATNAQAVLTVTQSAAPDLQVVPLNRTLSASNGTSTFDITVTGGTNVAWSAAIISGNWLVITSGSQGTDVGQTVVTYGSNPTAESRSATLRFTSSDAKNAPIDVTLTQNAFAKLDVMSPNGGETLERGKKTKIKWLSQGDVPGTVRIELIKNGVFNRILKSGIVNDGKVGWRVKNVKKGGGYQIRIVSESNESIADLSDSTFTIVK